MRKIIAFFIFSLFLFAGVGYISVESDGYGLTPNYAVKNALINAVGEVKGINIYSKKEIKRRIREAHININDVYKKSIKLSDTTSSNINSITGGFVDKYRIIYVKKISPKEYKAKVIAYFSKYISPGFNPRNRISIVVLPFEYKNTYTFDGMLINGKALSERLAQSIINKLTQTRKFTVLDRQNDKYYQLEKKFLTSGDTDPIELSRLGKRLGADYFIIGQILDFGIRKVDESNYYTGASKEYSKGYATISYRILNIPTQQIKWSDTIDVDFKLQNLNRPESIINKAGDKIAQILVDQIIFNIYPPRIIDVQGKNVVINMGGNVIHEGEKYNIYALGKKLYDPYTKEFLGREEKEIGVVKITKVLPKVSYGKVIKGIAFKGSIIRKKTSNSIKKINKPNVGKDSMFDAIFHK